MSFVTKQVEDFDPKDIFECGQCFRWNRQEDGSYTGIASGKIANVKVHQNQLIINNTTEADFETFWKQYLDLDRDYGAIKRVLTERDPVIAAAISYGAGIRLLQQDPWETLISFIISQNNNIPRIKKCIESLCESFGEKGGSYGGQDFYTFPEPEVLGTLSVEDLDCCRFGYRAKYLVATAKQVVEQGKEKLNSMADPAVSTAQAFEYVSSFSGVGPKVANCIMLFSMAKYESFPIDVWVKKVMKELYNLEEDADISAFAAETFGPYSGMAQQYLFYYMRERQNVRTDS